MWEALLELLQVLAVAACAGFFTAILYLIVMVGKSVIAWATEFEDDFENENYPDW